MKEERKISKDLSFCLNRDSCFLKEREREKERIKYTQTLTSVVWSGAFVETREFKVDDASDSTIEENFVPNDKFDVRMLLLLLLNLNSIQGIAEMLRSPWVVDGEMLWKEEKINCYFLGKLS